jgi:hypothetical protein
MEVPMPESRRRLLAAMFGTAGVFAVQSLLLGLQAPPPGSGGSPRARVYPNGRDPNLGPQTEEHSKAQVEKTDSSSIYSLTVLKQAQEIEKLAKKVKGLAKG